MITGNIISFKYRVFGAISCKLASCVIVFCLFFTLPCLAQRVTLDVKNKSLVDIFDRIQQQVKIDMLGDLELLRNSRKYDFRVNDMELSDVLMRLSVQSEIDMFIEGKIVFIRRLTAERRREISNRVKASLKTSKLSGQIFNQLGEPLAGVSIRNISENRNLAASDHSGRFEIEYVDDPVLSFSMLGYQSNQLRIKGQKSVRIELQQLSFALDSLDINTGYSQRKLGSFTGAASVISQKELRNFNSNNTLKIIEAIEPAFKIHDDIFNGGNPNQIPQITVRGINNVGNYVVNSPLIILDGFEVTLERLYDLDINRIERIMLLKDVSSMVLYGSRGGNGVLLIETKKPKSGDMKISLDYRLSFTGADLSDYNLMNASEKLEFERFAGKYQHKPMLGESLNEQNINQTKLDNLYSRRLANVLEGVDTYWLKQPLQQQLSNSASLRLEGGNQKFIYGISGNMSRLNAVMKGSRRDRSGAQLNLVFRPFTGLEIWSASNYEHRIGYESPFGNFQDYALMNPYQRLVDSKGEPISSYSDETLGVLKYNPLSNALLPHKDETRRQLYSQSVFLSYQINESLTLKSNINYERQWDGAEKFISPLNSQYVEKDNRNKGLYRYSKSNGNYYTANINLGYNRRIAEHSFQVNLVSEARSVEALESGMTMIGLHQEQELPNDLQSISAINTTPFKLANKNRLVSGIITGAYAFQNAYFMDFSYRVDGSSKFGANNPYGQFWSLGTAYNLKNKLLSNMDGLTDMVLFVNTGVAGTDAFLNNMTTSSYLNAEQRQYLLEIGYLYNNQGNPNLKWPKISSTSFGTRTSWLQDRVRLAFFLYSKNTNRMVSLITTAPSIGIPGNGYYENIGKVRNVGFESEMYLRFYENQDKTISTELSLTAVRNRGKLLELSEELKNMNINNLTLDRFGNYNQTELYQVGESLLNLKGVQSLGIDPATGKEYFISKTNSITDQWRTNDIVVIGNKEAEVFGTMHLSMNYKALSLQAYLYYSIGGQVYNYTSANRVENQDPWLNTDLRALESRWKAPGDLTKFKNIGDADPSYLSSRFVENESYIRLSSILLNYDVPPRLIERYRLKGLRLQLAANDLFFSSTVKMERGLNYPMSRSFNFGLLTQF